MAVVNLGYNLVVRRKPLISLDFDDNYVYLRGKTISDLRNWLLEAMQEIDEFEADNEEE